jgi:O-antigen/teichoic acid export membrane protein
MTISLSHWITIRKKTIKELFFYSLQTYGSTLLSIVSAFIIVRILSKELYGLYGVIFSGIGVLSVFLNGGVVRLSSSIILKSALKPDERDSLIRYTRQGFITMTVLAFLSAPLFLLLYGWHITLYLLVGYLSQISFDFLNLVYLSEVRERRLRDYAILSTSFDYIRVFCPLIGILLTRTILGFFIGLMVAVFLSISVCLALPYWRRKMLYYLQCLFSSFSSQSKYAHHVGLGLGVALESGAGTLYISILLLVASKRLGLSHVADLKVLLGYFSTILLLLSPLTRWVGFHLPKKIESANRPFLLFLKISLIGFATTFAISLASVIVGPWLLPVAFGSAYGTLKSSLIFGCVYGLTSGMFIGLGVISRQFGLSWKNAMISLINLSIGSLFLMSSFGPTTLNGFALFYGVWIFPASVASFILVYFTMRKRKMLMNAVS